MPDTTLTRADPTHLPLLMSWFADESAIRHWAGPDFRFPFDADSFRQDSKFDELASYVLTNDNKIVAFGQCYDRLGCCHLARLVVSPACRGLGLAPTLVNALIDAGRTAFNTQRVSLFVGQHNTVARALYGKLGFVATDYPEAMPLDGHVYMIKDLSR